jgi:hypothetical protein
MRKAKIYYHSVDIDGWLSCSILTMLLLDKIRNCDIEQIGYSYEDITLKIEDNTDYYFVDCILSANSTIVDKRSKKKELTNIIVFDHHTSNIKSSKYVYEDFAKDTSNNVQFELYTSDDTSDSGAKLVYDYALFEASSSLYNKLINPNVELFVRNVSLYDTFAHKNEDSSDEHRILCMNLYSKKEKSPINGVKNVANFLNILMKTNIPNGNILFNTLYAQGNLIWADMVSDFDALITDDINNLKVSNDVKDILLEIDGDLNMVANIGYFIHDSINPYALNIDNNYEFNMYIKITNYPKYIGVTLYSNKLNYMDNIAKKYNGGGHPKAAGFRINK